MARLSKYPYIKDIKVGDRITIHERPRYWSGKLNNNCGLREVKYPYSLLVTEAQDDEEFGGIRFTCGHYGWYYEDGYPMTLDSSSFHKGTVTVEHGSVNKADPISVVSSSPTLIYGTPPKVNPIQGTNKSPIIVGTGVTEALRLWKETGNFISPRTDRNKSLQDFISKSNMDFLGLGELEITHENFKPMKDFIIERQIDVDKLGWFEVHTDYLKEHSGIPDHVYGVSFIHQENVRGRMIDYLSDMEYESIGYYRPKHLAYAIGVSVEAIEELQADTPSSLGRMVFDVENGIERLADSILSDNYTVLEIVGNTFDWDNSEAYPIIIRGKKYYAYYTY